MKSIWRRIGRVLVVSAHLIGGTCAAELSNENRSDGSIFGEAVFVNIMNNNKIVIAPIMRPNDDVISAMKAINPSAYLEIENVKLFKVRLIGISAPSEENSKIYMQSPVYVDVRKYLEKVKSDDIVMYACYRRTFEDVLICSIFQQMKDISFNIIKMGGSRYDVSIMRSPDLDAQYHAAEMYAKRKKLGIWSPYYDFLYEKHESQLPSPIAGEVRMGVKGKL